MKLLLRRIVGRSMEPNLVQGDLVVFVPRRGYSVGDVVLARHEGQQIVKRITRVEGERYYLVGDNRQESTDSRHYGMEESSAIIGSIMINLHFVEATKPPKLVLKQGVILGRVAAAVLVAMAVIHLFRIDTFIPILDQNLPGGQGIATAVAMLIVLSEVFAIPFLLRIKLSPLAHIKSGALVAFAPLWWLLITIWAYRSPDSIGQLGEFMGVYATPLVLVVNIVWVGFNYYTLYALGYNHLKVADILSFKKK